MEFADRVLELIEENNITKNKLLTDLKLSKNSFVNWSGRGTIPSGETVAKIAKYFNVSVNFLLGLPEKEQTKSNSLELDTNESFIIEKYRSMSPQGQEYVLQTIAMAAQTYKKDNSATYSEKNIG